MVGSAACGCCNVGAFTEAVTVLTVGVGVGPAVTTDGKVTVEATCAAADTAGPLVTKHVIISFKSFFISSSIVTKAAEADGGCVLAARDVDDWVLLTVGTDCESVVDCFNSRSRFTCVTMLVI